VVQGKTETEIKESFKNFRDNVISGEKRSHGKDNGVEKPATQTPPVSKPTQESGSHEVLPKENDVKLDQSEHKLEENTSSTSTETVNNSEQSGLTGVVASDTKTEAKT